MNCSSILLFFNVGFNWLCKKLKNEKKAISIFFCTHPLLLQSLKFYLEKSSRHSVITAFLFQAKLD